VSALTLVTPPTASPVSLAEAKAMLKFDDSLTADDALIVAFLKTAVAATENFLNRRLMTQTWEMKRDAFPCGTICLPYGRLQSVASINYLDTASVNQTWATDRYRVDTDSVPGRVTPGYGEVYPYTHPVTNAVTIRFVCGYGDTPGDVPEEIRMAILLATRIWYDQRVDGNLPKSAEMLLWPHRLVAF
jgi:uncharacterized phiE125 gp8 family phage protein